MNFVDFVINFYNAYHLTCNSSLFASCTHYTSYSLLNIVHVIVCVFRFDQPSLKLLWVLFVQNILCVWVFKGRMVENLNFGKTGFKSCVLKKHFISYSCIFISYIQCFKVCFQKLGYFSKKMFLPDFRLIQSDFWSIKILLKNFSEPLSGSIDRTCFSINQISWIRFFFKKKLRFDLFIYFFKTFSNFPLSPTWQGSTEDFLSFSTKFFARFFSPKAGKTFIPLLLLLFSWFHA